MKDRLEELITKYWTRTLTKVEEEEMERLLKDHPEEWIRMGLLHQVSLEYDSPISKNRLDEISNRILLNDKQTAVFSGENSKKRRRSDWIKRRKIPVIMLMALLLLAFTGYQFLLPAFQQKGKWLQVKTADGMKTSLHLSDGTQVWLNAGSSLRYPENFSKNNRTVFLTGEAYFKVKHQPDRPFIIHTPNMDANVLGTELDVHAYPDEDYVETALINGAVKVVLKNGKNKQSFYLKPKQKIVFHNQSGSIKIEKELRHLKRPNRDSLTRFISKNISLTPLKRIDESTLSETAWRKDILIYDNEPLDSLAHRLGRWYGVTFTIKDSVLARERFTGRADNVSLEKLLHILQMLKPFTYTIQGKHVIIQ